MSPIQSKYHLFDKKCHFSMRYLISGTISLFSCFFFFFFFVSCNHFSLNLSVTLPVLDQARPRVLILDTICNCLIEKKKKACFYFLFSFFLFLVNITWEKNSIYFGSKSIFILCFCRTKIPTCIYRVYMPDYF